jgi:hypothetical protein
VVGAAKRLHTALGPGLLERVGLLKNVHVGHLRHGIRRKVNTYKGCQS